MGDVPTKEEQEAEHLAKKSAAEVQVQLHNDMRVASSPEERADLMAKDAEDSGSSDREDEIKLHNDMRNAESKEERDALLGKQPVNDPDGPPDEMKAPGWVGPDDTKKMSNPFSPSPSEELTEQETTLPPPPES